MAPDPLEVLRTVPLFGQVPEEDLRALAGLVRERRQPKGSMILKQAPPLVSSIEMLPPWSCTNSLVMDKPSPVPPYWQLLPPSSCRNGSKMAVRR